MIQIAAYTTYLLICFTVTIFVGRNLYNNGYHLILDLFKNEEFTRTINNFLLIGYYLINLGYIAITINSFPRINTMADLISEVSYKTGLILLILGLMHVNNIMMLLIFSRDKKRIVQFFNQ